MSEKPRKSEGRDPRQQPMGNRAGRAPGRMGGSRPPRGFGGSGGNAGRHPEKGKGPK